ncbi:MAG: PQQ-binding-like beta-propeller repeat protein [Planctomycetes bacterium]|nr:PQQ-binding-like beta-propeller repeat protein [Planctomycetota bacterium]
MTSRIPFLVSGLLCYLFAGVALGQEWTQFRGPNGQGISRAKSIPITWTDQDYNWKIKLPGPGHSSPVVWADRVFVTCAEAQPPGGIVLAVDVRAGKVLWQQRYGLTAYQHHGDNSYAAATPVVDAEAVYLLWQTARETIVTALDHAGRGLWRRDLPGVESRFGPGASPIVVGDLVVFTHEQEGDKLASRWLALDRRTGQTRWTVARENTEISCSTPCVFRPGSGKPQLIFTSETHGFTGVDPETGSVLWESRSALPARVVGSPVLAGDIVISGCGKGSTGNQLAAVRIPADSTGQPAVVYTLKGRLIPYVPTPLVKDGLLYAFHDQGTIRCLRVETGEEIWSHKPAGTFYGSPIWVNGLLYAIDRQGKVVVLRAGPTYELLATHPLGEKSHATPAIADGVLYLRTYSHLFSLGGTKP